MTSRPTLLTLVALLLLPAGPIAGPARVLWSDAVPVHAALRAGGVTEASFDAYVARVADENRRRVREGDLDHLVHYLLQSTTITSLPPIEPAVGARALVEALPPERRAAFLRGDRGAAPPVPAEVRARIDALLRQTAASRRTDPRLAYFAALLDDAFPDRRQRAAGLGGEYLRAMRFLYQKEFVAQQGPSPAASVAELYRRRGLSTDTAIEAGYVVYLGLGVLKALQPEHRVRRVLVIGPGLDLAPRTGLDESVPPESLQPWTVMDAVVSLGLGRLPELEVVAADINPRVVAHLRGAGTRTPVLHAAPAVHGAGVALSPEFGEYVDRVGGAIGTRRHQGEVTVGAPAIAALRAEGLDIVTERLAGERFDLIVATNILPYFDDTQLALAMSSIAAMLAPGGAFVHNEQRPVLGEMAAALGLPLQQSRHAVIATVTGAKAPLYDSVFLHLSAAPRPR